TSGFATGPSEGSAGPTSSTHALRQVSMASLLASRTKEAMTSCAARLRRKLCRSALASTRGDCLTMSVPPQAARQKKTPRVTRRMTNLRSSRREGFGAERLHAIADVLPGADSKGAADLRWGALRGDPLNSGSLLRRVRRVGPGCSCAVVEAPPRGETRGNSSGRPRSIRRLRSESRAVLRAVGVRPAGKRVRTAGSLASPEPRRHHRGQHNPDGFRGAVREPSTTGGSLPDGDVHGEAVVRDLD